MATVKELKEFLNTLNEDEELFIGYSDEEETRCAIWTEQEIIVKANKEDSDRDANYTNINDALAFLMDSMDDYHYSLIEI